MDVLKKIKNYTYSERHCLGQGSFGKVFEATSDEGKRVAIKKIEQRMIAQDTYLQTSLQNEISIMQKLKHPNIVELHEVINTANSIYLVLQYCSGGDLKAYCRGRVLSEDEAMRIIKQLVEGFKEMSKFGVIHRDLKPANILVHEGLFKICDFGFAKIFCDMAKMTKTFVGTPIYMSPQVLHQRPYTHKADIWSLGIMAYQLIFNKLPYNGYSQEELFKQIMKGPPVIPPCRPETREFLFGSLVLEEKGRWGWHELFSHFSKEIPMKPAEGLGLFYKEPEQKVDLKRVNLQIQPPQQLSNNLVSSSQGGGQFEPYRKYDQFKPKAKNMLAQQSQEGLYPQPEEQESYDNPRFLYFLLIELIVNPIEGAMSFDVFLYSLYKLAVQKYEIQIERQSKSIPMFSSVLQSQLGEIRKAERDLRVKRAGDVRKLALIVMQQGLKAGCSRRQLVWLDRFINRKYNYQPVE